MEAVFLTLPPPSLHLARSVCKDWLEKSATSWAILKARIAQLRRDFVWEDIDHGSNFHQILKFTRKKIIRVGDTFGELVVTMDGTLEHKSLIDINSALWETHLAMSLACRCGNFMCFPATGNTLAVSVPAHPLYFLDCNAIDEEIFNNMDQLFLAPDTQGSKFFDLAILPKSIGPMYVCRFSIKWRIGVWHKVDFTRHYSVKRSGTSIRSLHSLTHGYVLLRPGIITVYATRPGCARRLVF